MSAAAQRSRPFDMSKCRPASLMKPGASSAAVFGSNVRHSSPIVAAVSGET